MAKKPRVTKIKTHYAVEGEIVDKKPTPSTAWRNAPTIIQFPNKPLLIAIFALLVAGPLPGFLGTIARIVAICALGYWSYLEIEHGINGFRRFLGWLVALLALNMAIHLLFY